MAAIKYVNHIDMGKLEVRFALAHPLSSAPASPATGQFYYDTALDQLRTYNGSSWNAKASDSALLGGQNLAYTVARANHTGTQLAATISNLSTTVQAYTLNTFATPVADVSMGGYKLTNVATPISSTDAANMAYVQSQVSNSAAGIDSKPSVRLMTATNNALSGLAAIDGVTPVSGDRILATGQTTASTNGVYVAAAGAWARATDADATGEITPGATWFVEEGTSYGATTWRCATTGTITIGSTAISITQLFAAVFYTGSNGILLTGTNFTAVAAASGGLTVGAGGISLDTAIAVRKYSTNVGDGSSTSITVTHNLGTQDVQVQLRDTSQNRVETDWQATTTNTVTLSFVVAPTSSQFRVTVQG